MHRTSSLRIRLVVLLALAVTLVPSTEAKKRGDDDAGIAVERFLVLGPAQDALPAFHDDAAGGVKLDSLLEQPTLPHEAWHPAGGDVEPWFGGGGLAWSEVEAGADGRVRLDEPRETSPDRPATAWLATYVRVDRRTTVRIALDGSRPRALWLDGARKASGGGDPDAEVETELALDPGRHLLLVRTVTDGEAKGAWTVGVRVLDEEAGEGLGWATSRERDLTILDVLDAARVGSMAISPDGRYAALSLTRTIHGTDDTESWVEVRRTDGGALVRTWRGSGGLSRVAWAPVGRKLSYVGKAPGENRSTIWVSDLDDDTETAIVEGVERLGSYAWSPTGDVVVFSTGVEPEKNETGIKRLRNLLDRQAGWRERSYLHMVTVPGGARRRITAGEHDTSLAAFSPDGKRILFTRSIEDLSRRPFTVTELWEMDLATLESRRLLESPWLRSA